MCDESFYYFVSIQIEEEHWMKRMSTCLVLGMAEKDFIVDINEGRV